jgi:hypothetical protein
MVSLKIVFKYLDVYKDDHHFETELAIVNNYHLFEKPMIQSLLFS